MDEVAETEAAVGLNAMLRNVIRRSGTVVPPALSGLDALRAMDAAQSDVAVVVDPASGQALGTVTPRDLLHRVLIEGSDPQTPVAAIMTGGPVTLSVDATVQRASLLMFRHRLRHLVLVEADGAYFGVISRHELSGLQVAGSESLTEAIIAAASIAELADCAREVRRFAARRLAEGVGPEAICQWISVLNDLVTVQVIDTVEADFDLPYVPWSWLAFGSEGRLEQTLVSDQDNGIVFAAADAAEADHLRSVFLPFALAVNQALDQCGMPLCKGGVMASNASWCLSLAEWKHKFAEWIAVPEPMARLNATIFFDFRPLYGVDALANDLRNWLLAHAPGGAVFLAGMAAEALQHEPPLGLFGRFRCDDAKHRGQINLKTRGVRLFVDAARIFALAHGCAATNTVQRLRGIRAHLGMPIDEMAGIIDAFYQIQRLRLRHQLDGGDYETASLIDPKRLHELDRQILKEAFRAARRLQFRLSTAYVK